MKAFLFLRNLYNLHRIKRGGTNMEDSKNLATTYSPREFEDRIYRKWEEKGYFTPKVDKDKKPYTIVMPPPNITGKLHLGHALDNTLQDILIRVKRMQGYSALWLPGVLERIINSELQNLVLNSKRAYTFIY
jgi:valyl-tRNA synthetase